MRSPYILARADICRQAWPFQLNLGLFSTSIIIQASTLPSAATRTRGFAIVGGDSLLPLDRGLEGLEHLLHGLTDLRADAIARYERDGLGLGIARGWDVCNFVARLQVHSAPRSGECLCA